MSWGMNQNETAFAPIRQRLFRNRGSLASLLWRWIWFGKECSVHYDAPPKSPLCKASCSRTRFCCKIGREMKCADCNATNKHNLMQEIRSSKTFTADFEISSYLTHPSQTHLRGKRLAGQVLYFVSFWKHYLGSLLEPSFRGVRAALAFLRKATTGGWHCVEVAEEAEEGKLWCNSDSKLSVPAGLPGSHLQLASTTGFQDCHQIVVQTSKVEILSKGKSKILSVIAGKWAEQNICKDIARSCEIFRENRKISFHKKTEWKTRDQTDI